MGKNKHLRREERAQTYTGAEVKDMVLQERSECVTILEDYARKADTNGMVIHPRIARDLARAIEARPR